MTGEPTNLGTEPAGVRAGPQETPAQVLEPSEPMYIVVRSTIHLPGLPRGHEALVDATSEYIQGLIEAQWLVPVGADDEMGWGE